MHFINNIIHNPRHEWVVDNFLITFFGSYVAFL